MDRNVQDRAELAKVMHASICRTTEEECFQYGEGDCVVAADEAFFAGYRKVVGK